MKQAVLWKTWPNRQDLWMLTISGTPILYKSPTQLTPKKQDPNDELQ